MSELVQELRMMRDQLLVKPLEWEPSKLVQVVRKGRTLRGIVIAAGPGDYVKKYKPNPDGKTRTMTRTNVFRPTQVKPGDTVELGGLNIFDGQGYNFPEVYVGAERHLICQEADVVLVGSDDSSHDEVVSDR